MSNNCSTGVKPVLCSDVRLLTHLISSGTEGCGLAFQDVGKTSLLLALYCILLGENLSFAFLWQWSVMLYMLCQVRAYTGLGILGMCWRAVKLMRDVGTPHWAMWWKAKNTFKAQTFIMYYHSYGLCWRPQLAHSLLKLLNLTLKRIQDHPSYAKSYRPVRVT